MRASPLFKCGGALAKSRERIAVERAEVSRWRSAGRTCCASSAAQRPERVTIALDGQGSEIGGLAGERNRRVVKLRGVHDGLGSLRS
jgi:hypothetical protein